MTFCWPEEGPLSSWSDLSRLDLVDLLASGDDEQLARASDFFAALRKHLASLQRSDRVEAARARREQAHAAVQNGGSDAFRFARDTAQPSDLQTEDQEEFPSLPVAGQQALDSIMSTWESLWCNPSRLQEQRLAEWEIPRPAAAEAGGASGSPVGPAGPRVAEAGSKLDPCAELPLLP